MLIFLFCVDFEEGGLANLSIPALLLTFVNTLGKIHEHISGNQISLFYLINVINKQKCPLPIICVISLKLASSKSA
jgi:hypothetical protein